MVRRMDLKLDFYGSFMLQYFVASNWEADLFICMHTYVCMYYDDDDDEDEEEEEREEKIKTRFVGIGSMDSPISPLSDF